MFHEDQRRVAVQTTSSVDFPPYTTPLSTPCPSYETAIRTTVAPAAAVRQETHQKMR